MSSTSDQYALPYPDGTDRVAVAADVKGLAVKSGIELGGVESRANTRLTSAEARLTGVEETLGGSLIYRGVLPDNADLDTLTAVEDNGIWGMSSAGAYLNSPFPGAGGQVTVNNGGVGSGSQEAVQYGFNITFRRNIRNYYTSPISWRDWELTSRAPLAIPDGANLNDYRDNGEYIINNTSTAESIVGGWPSQIPRGPLSLRVRTTSAGIVFQQAWNYGVDATFLFRATESLGTTPFPFTAWREPVTELPAIPAPVGLANSLRVDDWSNRRGGTKNTNGTAAVALRFDHGLNNFDSIIRPLLETRGLPYCLALNSGAWGTSENSTVSAAMVDGWVAGGLCEVWNHARYHWDADTDAEIYDHIVNGLTELRSQLPSAQIDGFIVPGVGGTGFNGFESGATPEAFYGTYAGQLILEHHAVSSGAFTPSGHRTIDGRVRQGQGHFTLDSLDAATAIQEIGVAQDSTTGLQLMMHPSLVDGAGNMSTADFTSVLDHIVTERDAGRLTVLSPYDLLLATAG